MTSVRDIVAADLDRVVELDRRLTGTARRTFHEKRLKAAQANPDSFVAVAVGDGALSGYAFAHILDGEFGGVAPVGVVDALGVDPDQRGRGHARALMAGLEAAMVKRGVREVVTQADWTEHGMVGFFQSAGFALAPRLVLERGTNALDFDIPAAKPERRGELNLSDPSGDDFAALSRDLVPVRSMSDDDYPFIVAVDRKLSGRDRAPYYRRKVAEVLKESGVRVSLVAEIDGQFAGFVMARTDFGAFGRSEPTAVLDTIGVDPAYARANVGRALMSQLLTNLGSLNVEKLQTQVAWNDFPLLGFLARCGFTPSQRLSFTRRLG
ncbi:MAG: N-acetyltransferase family protein [Actinomycetota bacterium]